MKRRIAYTLVLLTTVSLGLSSAASAGTSTIYSVAPIDVSVGWSFRPNKINDLGQVVGDGQYTSGGPRGLMWDRQTHTTYVLPDLPGGKDESYACGINNSGQVAGYSSETWAGTWSAKAALVWTPTTGQVRVLDHTVVTNPNINHSEIGMAINTAGLVAGQALSSAALWDTGGHLQDLGGLTIPNCGSYAYDLNDHNDVTGFAYIPVGTHGGVWAHAFLRDGGTTGNMYDLGVLPIAGHEQSFGRAINNAGSVVGYSIKADCQARAFYKSWAGSMVSISASLPAGVISRLIHSLANDINDSNQVVGECLLKQFEASDEEQQAFVWGPTSGGQMLSDMLDSSGHGMAVRMASAINNRGEIVIIGMGDSSGGWYILTPHEVDSDPLPQGPGVGANLLGGSGGSQPGGLDLTFDNVLTGGTLSAVYRQTDATSFANGYLNNPSDIGFVLSGLPGGNVQFWEVALEGGAFDMATLTVHYDDSLLPVGFDETTLGISHYHEGVWENLSAAARDTFANTITFETTGFSSFVLTPEPATLSLLALGGLAALARRASAPLLRLR